MKPTIAALVINYNDSAFLPDVFADLLAQTVPFDEIVIVDDASTDHSVEVIERLIREVPYARLHRNEKNMGVVATVNRGFELCTSDFVHAISANDRYFPCIVECAQRMLARYPGAAMISGNSALWDALENKAMDDLIVRIEQVEQFVTPQDYAARSRVAPVSLYGGANTIRRDAFFALGKQDAGLAWYADWFIYYMVGLTYGFAYVPERMVTLRLEGTKSYSSGRFDWVREKPALLNMIEALRTRYPAQGKVFREAALLPRYNLKVLAVVMARSYRWFITPLFVWRCIGHHCGFWLKGIMPRRLLMALRSRIRL